ncbi:hypothetical protein D3875_02460 [Deinococcus cavernae]|uniref:Uncharacterized protein n=1 Tax=Deinococcus cavernae TaxID=2320857 RepID=A0A418VFH6_9DEIO|nr:hypothetical protein D3875_02460 [Deinococcus cavernae]
MNDFMAAEPGAIPYIKRLLDAQDFLHGKERWCLWLVNAGPEIQKMPRVMERVRLVKATREASKSPIIRKFAEIPTLFVQRPHTGKPYLAVPCHTSERREYVPFGFMHGSTVINNALFMVPDADLLTFGIMMSRAHVDWMRLTSGRLKSDYRYNKELTYNTFPWPDRNALTPAQIATIEKAAAAVLDARLGEDGQHRGSLAEMYNPLTMSPELRKAHNTLDRAVDRLYGLKAGSTEAQRLTLLLGRYQELNPTLESQGKAPRRKKPAPRA